MEFDWSPRSFLPAEISNREIEESFEDPFCIRLLPDVDDVTGLEARYFVLGKSVSNRMLFSVFWTDGKKYRVIFSRLMTDDETAFYERKNSELN